MNPQPVPPMESPGCQGQIVQGPWGAALSLCVIGTADGRSQAPEAVSYGRLRLLVYIHLLLAKYVEYVYWYRDKGGEP